MMKDTPVDDEAEAPVVLVPREIERLEADSWPDLVALRRQELVEFLRSLMDLTEYKVGSGRFVTADGYTIGLVDATGQPFDDSYGMPWGNESRAHIQVLPGAGAIVIPRSLVRRLRYEGQENDLYGTITGGIAWGCTSQDAGRRAIRAAIGLANETTGGEGVYVGILDSGYDPRHGDHEALVAFHEFRDGPGAHIYAPLDRTQRARLFHGTRVVRHIAGQSDGVAPGALIVMACALTGVRAGSPYGIASQLIAGLDWLTTGRFDPSDPRRTGCDIFNLSLTFEAVTSSELTEFQRILRSIRRKDRLIVWAAGAGNSPNYSLDPPSNHADDLCVGALDRTQHWMGNNRRDVVLGKPEVCAPADSTSLAAAIVTGIGARFLEQNPKLSARSLKEDILKVAQEPILGLPPLLKCGRVYLS